MERRKTLKMTWDGLGDDDDNDELFFESYERLSCAVPLDLASSSDEDDDYFDDPRTSFHSATSSVHSTKNRAFSQAGARASVDLAPDYGVWMAAPASITERRKQLLHGMGLNENREFVATSVQLGHAISKKFENGNNTCVSVSSEKELLGVGVGVGGGGAASSVSPVFAGGKTEHPSVSFVLVRSRSEGDIDSFSTEKLRKEELIGKVSKQHLTRTATQIAVPRARMIPYVKVVAKDADEAAQLKQHARKLSSAMAETGVGAFFLIKNLDTGKEFIVNEYGENGMWNRLSDLQTGKQLTMEEFEKTVGHSRVVNELMRRVNVAGGYSRKLCSSSYISRSLRLSKRRGAALLKNIKGVASGFIGEREREAPMQLLQQQVVAEAKPVKNRWVKVRQSGKSHKELSALHLCQEIQAHEGCIWSIKFSFDGRFLASAGEDKVIHVWEVHECEVLSIRPEEGNLTPIHPSLLASMERNSHGEAPPLSGEKKKKGRFGSRRADDPIPDHVHVPETVFSLSDKPFCSFNGHLDEVLDLSWSKSQLLLSSSMDKTARLWDLETRTCLKMFAHNDYVTCIQFNPTDEDYFISGSLDAKVRIWNIPERHVVDWTDIHEMVTAISYTPDGQGALVGTHKGGCRTYSTADCKLRQTGTIEIHRKKKSHLRKITGFQFSPGNPSQVLVTSADSRIKVLDGSEVVQKFKGFRNANSQIAASFSPNGRYIVSASEDSQVYIWKHQEHRSAGNGKGRTVRVTQSHENFQCKDVSIAIPWPYTIRGDPPPVQHSKWYSKRAQAPSSGVDDTTAYANSRRLLPPIPKKSNNHATESALTAPDEDPAAISHRGYGLGDSFANSRSMLPPLPKKTNCQATESASTQTEEEDLDAISRTDSGVGDSFGSGSASIRYGDSPSISAAVTPSSTSWSSNYSLLEGSQGSSAIHPSAWGLVIVTAGYGGAIRCYQNFGLPRG